MATLLRFLSVFCLAPFLLSLHAIAEMTVPSDRNRPASERTENDIDGFGDSSRMAASRSADGDFVIGEQRLGKQLLQNDADSSNPGEPQTADASQGTENLVCESAQSMRAL